MVNDVNDSYQFPWLVADRHHRCHTVVSWPRQVAAWELARCWVVVYRSSVKKTGRINRYSDIQIPLKASDALKHYFDHYFKNHCFNHQVTIILPIGEPLSIAVHAVVRFVKKAEQKLKGGVLEVITDLCQVIGYWWTWTSYHVITATDGYLKLMVLILIQNWLTDACRW